MALVKKTLRSFSGGMLDKDLTGRQDLAKYAQGCLELVNFKVRKQGNVIKRAGTNLAADVSALVTGSAAKLIPLVQERESGLYVLIAGGKAYLVSSEKGVRLADGTWSTAPAASDAEEGAAAATAVPFDDADLRMLDHVQSGDTVFFAHRSYPPGKLVYSAGSLAYERIEFRVARGKQPSIASVVQKGKWTSYTAAGTEVTGGSDKEVEYCVTLVKDGIESAPSVPFAVSYKMPWPNTGSFVVTVDTSSLDAEDFDCFYVYKKEADVFGLVGTTSNQLAFVDVSDGFSVDGTLCPAGFTEFDKAVHLRESGNRFASATAITDVTENNYTYVRTAVPVMGALIENAIIAWTVYGKHYHFYDGKGNVRMPEDQAAADALEAAAGTTVTGATSRSGTAQKAASSITVTPKKSAFSRFKVGLGGICHNINKTTVIGGTYFEYVDLDTYDAPGDTIDTYQVEDKTVKSVKWNGVSTDFTPSPAVYYRATVTFADGTSCTVAAESAVDQSSFDKTRWTAVSGASPAAWRRAYADSELMYSYDGADAVIARMDANAPNVGSSVTFEIPDDYAGKEVVKVVLNGYSDEGCTVAADMVVNGFAAYEGGKYANMFTDDYVTPDLTITPPKAEDHFVNPGEYPGCVAIFQQRLVYAASADSPFTFWMSCTGDLYNFDAHEYVRASDAITASTAALAMPRINRMLVHRDLMLFADGGEWQVGASSGNAIAPSTVSAKLQSAIGCAAWLRPVALDTDIVFCDASGETLLATKYNFATDGYESSNLSVLSQRLFRNNPIVSFAYAQFPEGTIECVLSDGTIASLVYMKEHDVCAWSLHRLGGGWKAVCVAANGATVDGTSDVAFLARRTSTVTTGEGEEATSTSRVEWAVLSLRDIDPDDRTLLANLRMDAVRVVPGETAPAVASGETAVRVGASKWAVGCPFTSTLRTTSPEFTDAETAQMEVKNATEAEVRVIDGSGFTVRAAAVPAARATEMKVDCPVDETGADYSVAPGDADCRLPLAGANSRDGSVVLEHSSHLPLAVLSVTTSYRVEYANHGGGDSNGK